MGHVIELEKFTFSAEDKQILADYKKFMDYMAKQREKGGKDDKEVNPDDDYEDSMFNEGPKMTSIFVDRFSGTSQAIYCAVVLGVIILLIFYCTPLPTLSYVSL